MNTSQTAAQRPNQYPSNRDPSLHNLEAEKQMFGALDIEMDEWAKSVPGYREFGHLVPVYRPVS